MALRRQRCAIHPTRTIEHKTAEVDSTQVRRKSAKLAQLHRGLQNARSRRLPKRPETAHASEEPPGPLLANSIGSVLNVPGLYQTTLRALQRDYGNPRAVAASCSVDLLKIQPFKDDDPQGLRRFTLNLRAIVNTLELGGYGGEL